MTPITNEQQLEQRALELGLLPFFRSAVPGLSMEDMTPADHWFQEGSDGPWEWRMPVASRKRAVYGKFFHNKAGFISAALMPDFCNFRRDGYDFDTLFELGMAPEKCRRIAHALEENGPMRTRDLKRASGLSGPSSGFDAALNRLMMQGYVAVDGFEYALDKNGRPYGWGLARYALLDQMLGPEVTRARYTDDPATSLDRLARAVPGFDPDQIRRKPAGKR